MPREEEDDDETLEESEEDEEEESEEDEEDEEEEDEEEEEEDEELAKKEAIAKQQAMLEAEQKAEKERMLAKQEAEQEAKRQAMEMEEKKQLINDTHDEAIEVTGAEEIVTPPQSTKKDPEISNLKDEAHDAALAVDDSQHIITPRMKPAGLEPAALKDQEHDEEYGVSPTEARHIKTPPLQPVIGSSKGEELKNESHDVAFKVDDADSIASGEQLSQQAPPSTDKKLPAMATSVTTGNMDAGEESSSFDDDATDTNQSPTKPGDKGLYDPSEYDHLKVSKEVKDLFQFITVYKAHEAEVEPKLHPFIPDYIPAIGDIDGFMKVPRPDGKPDNLGLNILDEPGASQSNASVVALGLQYTTKRKVAEQMVARVEQAATRGKVIDKWITDMKELNQSKHRPQVNYSKVMPDLETLLQVWPADFEDLLSKDLTLPPAEIDLDLIQYVRVVCALLDIPCYSNLVESVHVLLSLYAEFKANPHFQGGAFSNLPL
eukprot:TRINITY_DN614_c0_g2_i1.p1 TRINITY_DN614_c0_g2~~TRINITY_DN614_c0_g2_i1.p1  ORF type:complete len:489 (+),score=155.59 TRINITY_DN614_c0_g2_i1:48-1514(+)